jgi:hypothetical protein
VQEACSFAFAIRIYPRPSVVGKFMLTDLVHRLGIAAPMETIYRVLTTEEGIRAW